MSKLPGTDDAGRPIVAELDRAETADEVADRKAVASAARRANQTTFNLVLALIASLGIVALIVLVVVRPQSIDREPIDFVAVGADAQKAVDVPLAIPVLPDGWTANRAELVDAGADGVQSWQIGLLTPTGDYIGLVQGIDANNSWVATQTSQAEATDKRHIGSADWNAYDRRHVDDPGNLAYALVGTFGRSTVVLGGTASDAEFDTLATAVAAELQQ